MCLWLCPRIGTNACGGDLEAPGAAGRERGREREARGGSAVGGKNASAVRPLSCCVFFVFFLSFVPFGGTTAGPHGRPWFDLSNVKSARCVRRSFAFAPPQLCFRSAPIWMSFIFLSRLSLPGLAAMYLHSGCPLANELRLPLFFALSAAAHFVRLAASL